MARIDITFGVNENRSQCVLELHQNGKSQGNITLDASDLDHFIRRLAQCRQMLNEQVVPELDPTSRIDTESRPAWRIPANHSGTPGDIMLILRHSGFGWLAFLLEPERALAIGRYLIKLS